MFVASAVKDDEVLFILPDGRHIVIAVVDVRGGKVFLGFDAPRDVQIHREAHIERTVVGGRVVRTVKPMNRSSDVPMQKIQADESDIEDLGRRVFDPLGVAEAYEELAAEGVVP